MVYVGKLVNGTPFTNAEGTPAEEKDVVMTLIPGFKEGLSQMKEGGKAVFVSRPIRVTVKTEPVRFRPNLLSFLK